MIDVLWNQIRRFGIFVLKMILYGGLSLTMLILAYTTYLHGGGFSDWQAMAVILSMLGLFTLIARIGVESIGETLSSQSPR